jgi:hypothetical protein
MSSSRALFGKSVYSLQGVSSIPSNPWTIYYRAWKAPSTDIVFDNVGSPVSYFPITITNGQSSATSNPFQEKITWNPSTCSSYEASNLGNIRFYSDSAFTMPLYAWLESCTPSLSNTATSATAWIKLTSPIAGNGGTLTIYMAFLSTSTDFDGDYWGTAPTLYGTYGQYDNGANVFNFYDNFNETTLSTKWTSSVTSGTLTVNNGIKLYTATASGSAGINFATAQSSSNIIVEAAMNVYGSSGNNIRDRVNHGLAGFNRGDFGYFSQSSGPKPQYYFNGYSGTSVPVSSSATSYNILDQQKMTSSGSFTWNSLNYPDYTSIYSNTASFTPGSTFTTGYQASRDADPAQSTSEIQMAFVRIRAYPPSDTMPSASFGSNSVSWNHTTGSGSNRIMIVGVSIKSSTVSVSSITYGAQSLTKIRSDFNSGGSIRSELWYLIAPASGTATVTVNLSGYAAATGGSCTYTGVAQTSPIDNSNGGSGSSTSPSQSVTVNTANSFLIGHVAISGNAAVSSEGSGQTQRWDQSIPGANRGHGSEQGPDGTGSQSTSWSLSSSAYWAVSVVAFKPAPNPAIGHASVDILIRRSDGSVRTAMTGVASSGDLSSSPTTLSGTYSWSAYTVVDQTDYLEIDYYVDVTTTYQSNAYLRIDDNSLVTSNQTRIAGIMLPSEYTVEVEFTGTSDTQSWIQIVWTVDSQFTTSSVTTTLQLWNYQTGSYPTSGDGYLSYTSSGTAGTDETKTQTITSNPTYFRDASGNWKLKIKGVKTTTSQFSWKGDLVEYKDQYPVYQLNLEEQFTSCDYSQTNEELCIYTRTLDAENLMVDVYTGSAWTTIIPSLRPNDWNNVTVASYLTSSTLRIRFWTGTDAGDTTQSSWQIDSTLIHIWSPNYVLDLEVQWTNADHNETDEYLCIYTDALGSESLKVDVWTGSWTTVINALQPNQWNNVSVSSYLTSSTFTIRFKGSTETGDVTQDSWNIDCTLLYTGNTPTRYAAEVEFTGSSDSLNWTGLDWTVESASTAGSVSITLQLYNFESQQYPTSGDGYISYTSGASGLDQVYYQNITANPRRFNNTDGTWKLKIKQEKTTSTRFNCAIDWIEFYPKAKENPVEIWLYNYGKIDFKTTSVYVNGLLVDSNPVEISIGEHGRLTVYLASKWTSGTPYHIKLMTERGSTFEGEYVSPSVTP